MANEPVTVFTCGPKLCVSGDGKPCDDDGPGVVWDSGGSTTCSRCGSAAIDRCMWEDDDDGNNLD